MEPKRSTRPRKRWLAVALVALGALGVVLAAQSSTVVVPQMSSYAVVDQRTIAVKVGVAPCSWTRVTNVAESPTEVRVTVETLPCPIPGPSTAALAIRELSVSLGTELGARAVEDANGQAVPLREQGDRGALDLAGRSAPAWRTPPSAARRRPVEPTGRRLISSRGRSAAARRSRASR